MGSGSNSFFFDIAQGHVNRQMQAAAEAAYSLERAEYGAKVDAYTTQFTSEGRLGFEVVPYIPQVESGGFFAFAANAITTRVYNGYATAANYGYGLFVHTMSGIDPVGAVTDDMSYLASSMEP
jgi:hypothetical protein